MATRIKGNIGNVFTGDSANGKFSRFSVARINTAPDAPDHWVNVSAGGEAPVQAGDFVELLAHEIKASPYLTNDGNEGLRHYCHLASKLHLISRVAERGEDGKPTVRNTLHVFWEQETQPVAEVEPEPALPADSEIAL